VLVCAESVIVFMYFIYVVVINYLKDKLTPPLHSVVLIVATSLFFILFASVCMGQDEGCFMEIVCPCFS
jgi:hypothetical protein